MFEFKHSINSRKSLFKGIRVGSYAKFAENIHPLLRAHLGAGKRIGRVGFFETVEDANGPIHLLDFTLLAVPDERGSGVNRGQTLIHSGE